MLLKSVYVGNQGKFDEEESAQSFQQALLEWRSNKNEDAPEKGISL